MNQAWYLAILLAGSVMATTADAGETKAQRGPLDPKGKIHIPIGIANTLDTLKTFVEAEGCFSPGFGSYGIHFWVYDAQAGKLTAPTMEGVACSHGLAAGGYLIPWSKWRSGEVQVKTEVCQVLRRAPGGEVHVVAARATLTNEGKEDRKLALYVVLRSLGPAGWPVGNLTVSEGGESLLVDGHPAIVAEEKPSAAGVAGSDAIGELATAGKMPAEKAAVSKTGDCSGALRFDINLKPGEVRTFGFICPVLPGRRAVAHQWDGVSKWAQLDLAVPNPTEGGALQPDPGLEFYRKLKADELFKAAEAYWKDLVGRTTVRTPDPRWAECLAAVTGHAAVAMNEGAPDVAVVNYNVFNRDGVYTANILQKSGHSGLASAAIDYFLAHPFNGRVQVEADNPGQVLWIMGEQWKFAGDEEWLKWVYPSARKLAAMIRYCRTTPGPHWVCITSLDFGDALPKDNRQELKPGSCDGHHPEYTEAFDIAGLRAACLLARAMGSEADANECARLADSLLDEYDRKFGSNLPKGYGSYCVLWPCRLYPLGGGKSREQFQRVGAQKPGGWRYFPLATAHQGLLAGNRAAGHGTLETHLDHEQVRGWYAFDEGGASGPGGWRHVRTIWKPGAAMPHGWAIAELWLLLRDSLVFEDGDRLVLLAGVPEKWFTQGDGITVENLPSHFGPCGFDYKPDASGAMLRLSGPPAGRSGSPKAGSDQPRPPGGFILRLPDSIPAKASCGGKSLERAGNGDVLVPAEAGEVRIDLLARPSH